MIYKTGADKTQLRRRNLAAVLSMAHHSRGVTRAELTRALGLNRSTIGDLVTALSEAHWVTEIDDAPREGAGRPSPRVVTTDKWLVAAVNPEVDAIDLALVALGGRVVKRKRIKVNSPSSSDAIKLIAKSINELRAEMPDSVVLGVGVAVPGIVRRSDGVVKLAPHLGWSETPFAQELSLALGLPVEVANDAHLGCRAESVFGAGIGSQNLVYLNGGPSGIGGGLIIDGRAVNGRDGHAGEIGHLCVDPAGPACACGAVGCLDALVRREHLTEAIGLEDAEDSILEQAVQTASPDVIRPVLESELRWLRIGLRGLVNMLNPEKIVLGGHLAILWRAQSAEDQSRAVASALDASARGVSIETAALGEDRLLLGAAELAWDKPLSDPLSINGPGNK